MPRLHCYDIKWDTDGEDVDLPDEVHITVDDDYDPDYEPAETLSREFGFCVLNLTVEED